MSRKPFIQEVIIHPVGANPYTRPSAANPDPNPWAIGDRRKEALKMFRDTGVLPDGAAAWDDGERRAITSPDEIDWCHMRD